MLIYQTIFGSRLYGTHTDTSDYDFASVTAPPIEDCLLGRQSAFSGSQKIIGEQDTTSMTISSFFNKLSVGNMTALELLFSGGLKKAEDSVWDKIYRNREKLLVRQSSAILGYCRNQANKYDSRGKKIDVLTEVMELMDSSSDLTSEKSEAMDKLIAKYPEFISSIHVRQTSGTMVLHYIVCGKMIPNTVRQVEAKKTCISLLEQYGKRTKEAAENSGIDWKGMMHAIRISEQGIEYFRDHVMTFPRHNGEYLRNIRQGNVSYDNVSKRIDDNLNILEYEALTSKLPESIDWKFVEDLMVKDVYKCR